MKHLAPLALALALSSALPALAEEATEAQATGAAKPSREQVAEFMRSTSIDDLVEQGLRAATGLGTYTYRMFKQERVKGKLLPVDEIQAFIREEPFAVRLHYVGGPSKGRTVSFAPAVKADEFRVREAGLLALTGAWWIGLDSAIAKEDSNHTARDAGYGALLRRFARDQALAKANGGYTVVHEGWNPKGLWCTTYESPKSPGWTLVEAKSRICTDVEAQLPMLVETFDIKGELVERYQFSAVTKVAPGADFFNPAKL